MDSPSLIDIVIVTWNSRDALAANLTALERLKNECAARVFFVENASGDGLPELIRQSAPWAELIESQTNDGFARGCNAGARRGDSPLILFLNPDAILRPLDLVTLKRTMDDDRSIGMAGPVLVDEAGKIYPSAHADPNALNYWWTQSFLSPLWRKIRALFPHAHSANQAPLTVDWLMGACLLVRREAFEAVGGFPEAYFMYSEDTELAWNLRRQGSKVVYVPQARCRHDHGLSSRKNALRTRVELFKSLRTYGERCRDAQWLGGMRRSVRLDMRARLAIVWLIRLAQGSFDANRSRREAFQAVLKIWK